MKWKLFEKYTKFCEYYKLKDKVKTELNKDTNKNFTKRYLSFECKVLIYEIIPPGPQGHYDDIKLWHKGNYPDGFDNLPVEVLKEYKRKQLDKKEYDEFKQLIQGNNPERVNEIFRSSRTNTRDEGKSMTERTQDQIEQEYNQIKIAAVALGLEEQCKELLKNQEVSAAEAIQTAAGEYDKNSVYEPIKKEIEKAQDRYGLSQSEILTIIKENILPHKMVMESLRIVAVNGLEVNGTKWGTKGKDAKLPEILRKFLKDFQNRQQASIEKRNKELLTENLYTDLLSKMGEKGSNITGQLEEPNGINFDKIKEQKKLDSAAQTYGKNIADTFAAKVAS